MKYKIIKVTNKEADLVRFIREEMPYGECLLITHNGQPARVEHIAPKKIFGLLVDNPKEESEKPHRDKGL